MTLHDPERLVAFLAGDLPQAEADVIDAHLLECRECWQTVYTDSVGRIATESLREVAAPELRDRVRLAVSLAPTEASRRPWWRRAPATLAVVAVVAAVVAVVVVSWSIVATTHRPADPLARIVRQVRAATVRSEVPTSVAVGARQLRAQEYDLDGGRVVVAFDTQPFPMPDNAREMDTHINAPWSAQVDGLRVLCITDPRPALFIGDKSVTVDSLRRLAHRLALT